MGAALVLCAAARDARAAAGDVDTSFGDGGVTRIDIGRSSAVVNAVFLHGDGKVTLFGTAGRTIVLARSMADGSPDPSFGDGGRVLTNPPGWIEGSRAAVLQPDGKLVVAGRAWSGTDYECSVARFLADGSPDPDFGSDGVTTTGIASLSCTRVGDVLVQPDGKILVVDATSSRLGLLRLDDHGTPDASFGSGGEVELAIAPRSTVGRAVALQSDGSIVVVGVVAVTGATDRRYFVARLDPSGGLDSSFGDAGKLYLDVGLKSAAAADVAVQPDDRIVVVVEERVPGGEVVALRFTADGAPDASFGSNGKARAIGYQFSAFRVVLESGGSILVGGALRDGSGFTVARLLANGVLQRRFGSGGFLSTTFQDSHRIQELAVGPSGGIVAAGATWGDHEGATSKLTVVRFQADGGRELAFGDRGVVTALIRTATDVPTGIATLPDGKIVVAGWTVGGGTGYDLAAARLDADGTLDDGFGVGGKIRIDSTPPDEFSDESPERDLADGIAVQPDGRIVGAGSWHDGQDTYKIIRLTATGDLDLSFGDEGGVRFGTSCDRFLYSVAVDATGSILAAGALTDDCGGGVELVRVQPDGTPDPSFADFFATDLRGNGFGPTIPLALGSDGSFVVGGRLTSEDLGAVARYAGTSPDPGFGVGGIAAIDFVEFASGIGALAVAADGSVLAAAGWSSENLSLVRLDPSGMVDEDFGNEGLASADFDGGQERPTALALQSDGKIVVAGLSVLGPAVRAVAARFTSLGELDPSFGEGGKVVLPVNPADLWYPISLAIAKDGGILLAEAARSSSSIDFVVTRLAGDSASVCGNGVIEPGEFCDDGNVASADGCDASCTIETCFRCAGVPSTCSAADQGDPACAPVASCPASGDQGYSDGDGDRRDDVCDHCPAVASADDDDADHDGVGDLCDLCPLDADGSNADADGDGVGDECDDCDSVEPLVDTRLRLSGLDTAPGDDGLVLRGSFELLDGETLESIVGAIAVEVHDVRDSVTFDRHLRNGSSPQQTGWMEATAPDAPWPWRYRSIKGRLPKVTAKLRHDPDHPGYAELNVTADRGAFASLEVELPLRAIVRRYTNEKVCAKVVHTEGGSPACEQVSGGTLLCR